MLMRLFFLLLICALAACSSEPADADKTAGAWPSFEASDSPATAVPESTTPLPRACDLVTAEQAQQVLGPSAVLMSDDAEACTWASSDHPGRFTMLMVVVVDNDDVAMAQEVFQATTGMQGNLSAMVNKQLGEKTRKSGRELEDLGDDAWLSSSNMDLVDGHQLMVRKGTRLLTLNVTGMALAKSEGLPQRLEDLARSAVPQL